VTVKTHHPTLRVEIIVPDYFNFQAASCAALVFQGVIKSVHRDDRLDHLEGFAKGNLDKLVVGLVRK
jgi:hypothetical protein